MHAVYAYNALIYYLKSVVHFIKLGNLVTLLHMGSLSASLILQIGRKVLGKVLELPLLEEVTGPAILVFFTPPVLNAF